jgi:hypothetical protein
MRFIGRSENANATAEGAESAEADAEKFKFNIATDEKSDGHG